MQIPHKANGTGPVSANQPIVKQAVTTNPNPIYQAVFLGSASTHSGIWFLVTNLPMIIEGEKRCPTKSLRNISSMNKTPKPRIGWKSSVTAAYIQAAKPIRNRIPAAARTSRSLKTGKSCSWVFSPKLNVVLLTRQAYFENGFGAH